MMPHFADDIGKHKYVNRRRSVSGAPAVHNCWYLLMIFLLLTPPIFGQINKTTGTDNQTNAKSSIYKIFETELGNYQPANNDSSASVPVSSFIPVWLQLIVPEKTDTLLMVGISDPGLPDSIARAQACLRALGLAAMARHCKSRFISDFYHKSQEESADSKFEEIYHFMASSATFPGIPNVIRDTILRSRETIVLVAVPVYQEPKGKDTNCVIDGYLYNYEFEVDGHSHLLRKIGNTISTRQSLPPFPWPDSISFYQVNQRFTGIKNIQQKINPQFNRFEYYYTPSVEVPSTTKESRISGSSCKSGLWIALLNQVFEQLSFFTKGATSQTQAVSDQTLETRNELNREKNQVDLRFSFGAINLSDNHLKVQIKISHEK